MSYIHGTVCSRLIFSKLYMQRVRQQFASYYSEYMAIYHGAKYVYECLTRLTNLVPPDTKTGPPGHLFLTKSIPPQQKWSPCIPTCSHVVTHQKWSPRSTKCIIKTIINNNKLTRIFTSVVKLGKTKRSNILLCVYCVPM